MASLVNLEHRDVIAGDVGIAVPVSETRRRDMVERNTASLIPAPYVAQYQIVVVPARWRQWIGRQNRGCRNSLRWCIAATSDAGD